jgi:hypothetical protein
MLPDLIIRQHFVYKIGLGGGDDRGALRKAQS